MESRRSKILLNQDEKLTELVEIHGKNWKRISEQIKTRSPVQCLHRWSKILKPGLIKGPWTIEEDEKLTEWVKNNGPFNWAKCSCIINGRSGKQCRERWFNSLSPGIKKGNWSVQEDYLIFKLFSQYGSKWAKIASYFKGRTENSIKNRFYSTLRRIAYEYQKKDEEGAHKIKSQKELLNYLPIAIEEKLAKVKESGNAKNEVNVKTVKEESDDSNNMLYNLLYFKAQYLNMLLTNTKNEMTSFDYLKNQVLSYFPNLFG